MKKLIAILLTLLTVFLSGCGTAAKNNKKSVAVSIFPIYIFTLNLLDGIEDIEIKSIGEQNIGCLHDYTITAKDARLIKDAQLLVINGVGMESFLEDLYSNEKDLNIADSSSGVNVLASSHQHNHSHHENSEEHNEFCSEVTYNSHIWLSVKNAKIQVLNIKNSLSDAFPEYETQINENYGLYIERLSILEKEISQAKNEIAGKKIYAFHEAYSYLSEDLGFHIEEIAETDDGGEPSAKKIGELCRKAQEEKIQGILTEPYYEGSSAEIISNETGVNIYTLNPVTAGEKTKTAYEDIMRENIKVLRAVN